MSALRRVFGTSTSFSRAMATAADSWGVEMPTLNLPGVTGTYAAALFTQAKKMNILDKVQGEVRSLREAIDAEPSFRDFLRDPTINQQKKGKVLQEILTDMKVSDVTKNFFTVLGDAGRLHEASNALSVFEGAIGSGATKAVVTTFEALSDAQKDELSATLQTLTGSKLAIDNRVDPFILGGMVVEVGDRFVDLTVRSRIKDITTILSEDK